MTTIQYILLLALFFCYGAIFGSFFNVLIYRLPEGESVVTPPSHCPKCNHQIRWFENIPMLSYLFLRAKCSGCGTHISLQYPLIEFITAVLSVVLFQFLFLPQFPQFSTTPWYTYLPLIVVYLTVLLFIPIALIDIRYYIIPDSLTISGTIISVALSFIPGGLTPQNAALGILVGAGTLFLFGVVGTKILKKEAMGMGDVKMLAWYGALFGPSIAFGTIFIGSTVGLMGSLVLMMRGTLKQGEHIPFGPYLCIGTFISLFWGADLWNWYSNITIPL